ncbi:MAG: alpha/beta hydrolase [Bacteroidota bacterium]
MSKANLILLHGALGSQAQMQDFKACLQDDFAVYDLNFEGHGGRKSEAKFSIERFAQNILALMAEKSIDQSHLFGYSMGGYVALYLAKTQPERVGRIATYATKFHWTPEVAAKEVKMLNPEIIEQKVPRFAQQLAQTHQPTDWKEVLHKTAGMMQELGEGKGLQEQDLQQISHRVLINVGDQDKMVGMEESKTAAQALPNGAWNILKDFVHPFDRIDVQKLSVEVRQFLQMP